MTRSYASWAVRRGAESHGRVSGGVAISDSHFLKLLLLICVKYTIESTDIHKETNKEAVGGSLH